MNAQPDGYCGEFDAGEDVGVVFLVSGRCRPVMLDPWDGPLDPAATAAGIFIQHRRVGSSRDRFDDRFRANRCEMIAQPNAVVGRIREQGLTRPDPARHFVGRAAIMGQSVGQFQCDRPPARIGDAVDSSFQAVPRVPHADGAKVSQTGGVGGRFAPIIAFAPCRWTRMDELSTDCSDPLQASETDLNILSRTPSFAHRAKRLSQVAEGP